MSNFEPYRIDLNEKELSGKAGTDSWADVMNEFEEWEKQQPGAKPEAAAAPTPAPVAAPAPAPAPAAAPACAAPAAAAPKAEEAPRPLTRYEELCRTPSMKMNASDMNVMTEFSEIIARVNEIAGIVETLRTEHPSYAPERFTTLWHTNMKESAQVMMREFHQMRHGRVQKKYDKKNICKKCHAVFMVVLPGGMCDECRADSATRNRPKPDDA